MTYPEFLKLARPYSFWKFTKKRQNNGSALVQVVDTFYIGIPTQDYLVVLDIREYKPDEEHQTKRISTADFLHLFETKTIEPYVPKV